MVRWNCESTVWRHRWSITDASYLHAKQDKTELLECGSLFIVKSAKQTQLVILDNERGQWQLVRGYYGFPLIHANQLDNHSDTFNRVDDSSFWGNLLWVHTTLT